MITLRDYQQSAVDEFFGYLQRGQGRAPLIVAPCGAGKSIIIAEIIRRAQSEWDGTRCLMLTHRQDLIAQNYAELSLVHPLASAGIYSAGLSRRDTDADVIYAGIQSVHNKAPLLGRRDVILIDECHLVNLNENSMYRRLLNDLRALNPNAIVGGLSATPYRQDQGYLHKGEGAFFDGIAYEIPITKLLDAGHLTEVVSAPGKQSVDTSNVKTSRGDFNLLQLAAAFDDGGVTLAAIPEILRHGENRRAWALFCTGIAHAEQTAELLRARGVECGVVTQNTPSAERQQILTDFREGRLRAVANVDVLTTGWNAPICDMLVMLRATQSASLYVQIVGRVMRNFPDKKNGLLLDYGGNVERHGPIDCVSVVREKPSDGDAEPPVKTCPSCEFHVRIADRVCPNCGHEFPAPEPKTETAATTAAVLSKHEKPRIVEIYDAFAVRHVKRNKKIGDTDSVRVEYCSTGGSIYSEWFLPEHGAYPRAGSQRKFRDRFGVSLPETIDETLELLKRVDIPKTIEVTRDPQNRKYWKITGSSGSQKRQKSIWSDLR